MNDEQIRSALKQLGVELKEPSPGHFQVTGSATMVNWWPFSKNRSAHVKGAKEGIIACHLEDVVAMANGLPPPAWKDTLNTESLVRIMGPTWTPPAQKGGGRKKAAQKVAQAMLPEGHPAKKEGPPWSE
jgi:hypothetical protein